MRTRTRYSRPKRRLGSDAGCGLAPVSSGNPGGAVAPGVDTWSSVPTTRPGSGAARLQPAHENSASLAFITPGTESSGEVVVPRRRMVSSSLLCRVSPLFNNS